jgi:7-cyano-7-deazaguanine synthase in queuosine biosynthesis
MDSTAVAIMLAKEYAKIHLLTCSTPYIIGREMLTAHRVRGIQRAIPSTVVTQSFASHWHYVKKLKQLSAAIKARSTFHLCTVCKVAMHLQAIETCLKMGIKYASSGIGVQEQQGYPDQLPELDERVYLLYSRAGIERLTPLMVMNKKEVADVLVPHGLHPAKIYPRCLVAPIQGLNWHFIKGPPAKEPILTWYNKQLPELEKIVDGLIATSSRQ